MGTKSYNSANLDDASATGRVMQIRLAIGDKGPTEDSMILENEEITFVLSQNMATDGSFNMRIAAIACCKLAMAAIRDSAVSYSKGKLSEQANQRLQNFEGTFDRLQGGDSLFSSSGYTRITAHGGGINLSDIADLKSDTGVRQPAFEKGGDNHPGVTEDVNGTRDDPWP